MSKVWFITGTGRGMGVHIAKALVQLASQDEPPLRWVAGADAVQVVEQKAKDMLAQVDAVQVVLLGLRRRRHRVTLRLPGAVLRLPAAPHHMGDGVDSLRY